MYLSIDAHLCTVNLVALDTIIVLAYDVTCVFFVIVDELVCWFNQHVD